MMDDELKHYGVLGMKWGVHRAKKKGTEYSYKSRATKKYEKKALKRRVAADDLNPDDALYKMSDKKRAKLQSKYEKESAKADKAEKKAKASAEFDKKMENIARKESVGKNLTKKYLLGGMGDKTYNMLKASGNSRGMAYAKTVGSQLLGGPLGMVAARNLARGSYIKRNSD